MIFRPERLVEAHEEIYSTSWRHSVQLALRLLAFYTVNVILYAAPLSLAGFGTVSVSITAPGILAPLLEAITGTPDTAWRFILTLAQNGLYLFTATVLTLLTFHLGVVLSGSSRGLLLSIRTVTYSTGLYLAAIFTLVWYLSTGSAIQVADEMLRNFQAAVVYVFIDLVGAELTLPIGRPETIPTDGLTPVGMVVLLALIVAALYYLYLLYLGARITHGASRYESAVAVGFVTVSPALYIIGSIIAFQQFGGIPL